MKPRLRRPSIFTLVLHVSHQAVSESGSMKESSIPQTGQCSQLPSSRTTALTSSQLLGGSVVQAFSFRFGHSFAVVGKSDFNNEYM
jgi:hypothetical protein